MRDAVKTWPTLEVCGVSGSQKGVPIAFLVAGVPDDHSVMAKLADELKTTHRVVIACPPLFDKQKLDSDQKTNWSLEELFYKFECTVFSVLGEDPTQEKKKKNITLIVHDMGSYFGYMFAFLHPDLIENFIGLDIGATVKCTRKKEVRFGDESARADRSKLYEMKRFKDLHKSANNARKVMCYQLTFVLCTLLGRHVSTSLADLTLHTSVKFFQWLEWFVPRDFTHSTRKVGETHWYMFYFYNALWYKILIMDKKDRFKFTYSSQYTSKKEGGEGEDHSSGSAGFSGLLPLYCPMPQEETRTMFLYGKRKRIAFHSEAFCEELRQTPSCCSVGLDGGHWFYLDQHEKTTKYIRDFLNGIVYKYAPNKLKPTQKL